MNVFRVQKDDMTFYVQSDRLQTYLNAGYDLYVRDTAQQVGGGGLSIQSSESVEQQIDSEMLAENLSAWIAQDAKDY